MKKNIALLSVVFLLMWLVNISSGYVTNTKHNLSADGGQATHATSNTTTTCGFCHVAHGMADDPTKYAPLWARSDNSFPFTLYGNGYTRSGTVINNPGASSLMCLACHDGSIAIGTVIRYGSEATVTVVSSTPGLLTVDGKFSPTYVDSGTGYTPNLGTDLRNDHPIGFKFPAGGYTSGGGFGVGGAPGITLLPTGDKLTGSSGANYPLFNGDLECATCHDPHTDNIVKFLRASTAVICQDCHNVK